MLQRETRFGENQTEAAPRKGGCSDLFIARGGNFIMQKDKQNYKHNKILPLFPLPRLEHQSHLYSFAVVQLKISTILKYLKLFLSL